MINSFLTELYTGDSLKALQIVENATRSGSLDRGQSFLLRLAILKHGQSFLYYQKLYNLWTNLGKPHLKPNATKQKLVLLTDFTADSLPPLLSIFCAAQGVEIEVLLSDFDSIEQTLLNQNSSLYEAQPDIVALFFSEHWFARHLHSSALVNKNDLDKVKNHLKDLVMTFLANSQAQLLIANLPGKSFSRPSGLIEHEEFMGWSLTIGHINTWLTSLASSRIHLMDIAETIFNAGGRRAMGQLNFLRARLAYEPAGQIAVAKELASNIAHLCGKTHRALLTDWDNTLWGGEVGDLGSHGVEYGQDSPDGLGYSMIQEFLKGLKITGVLLAGVSRNDPKVQDVFKENSQMALSIEDFSSLQINWNPKSDSISQVSTELGFGTDLMIFMDDSLFEIAQVLSIHPHIDIVFAGPDSLSTLNRLTKSRFFNMVSISEADLLRNSRAQNLKKQRELRQTFTNIDDFLKELRISIQISRPNDKNLARIEQLFQKTNQFNLTTRRHRKENLLEFEKQNGMVLVISYEDAFGDQGIISSLVLLSDSNSLRIESWLMSCRVLNRTVEEAVFSYIIDKANGKPIYGEYIPSEKNGLVRDLFARLGFQAVPNGPTSDGELWSFDPSNPDINYPKHFIEINENDC